MGVINTTGRRKTSVARVYLTGGTGKIQVNRRLLSDYFSSEVLLETVLQPLHQVGLTKQHDITINVSGGGITGQAEAIRLAIAKALCQVNTEHRSPLKKQGYLTRDSRMVERKKYGRRKARRKFQFSKR